MSAKSSIEWTESTWNPVTGCDRVSPGCDHCYAMTLAKRLKAMGNPRYQQDGKRKTSGPGFGVTLHHDQVALPQRWKKSRMIFVNSMSDLFHPDVPDSFIRDVFDSMSKAHQHTFQILTKRPRRMQRLLSKWTDLAQTPLRHVWLGVSVENQEWADKRVPLLLETPAAVRFLSCEPLLGPVDLADYLVPSGGQPAIHWVIVGGESGPRARPMQLAWARQLRDTCAESATPFFFKQWGGRTPKAGGRELEGRTWDQMPVTSSAAEVPRRIAISSP